MKKVNRIFLLYLSFCLIFCTAFTFFSVGAADLTPAAGSGGTKITATTSLSNQPDFTVSIPTGIPVGELQRTAESSVKSTYFDVGVSNVSMLNDKLICVAISTPDGTFNLYNGVYALPYKVYNVKENGEPLNNGDIFAAFVADATITGRVDVDSADIAVAGNYGGTLTFTVTVQDIAN